MLVSITEKQLLAVVIQVKQVPCGRGAFRQKGNGITLENDVSALWTALGLRDEWSRANRARDVGPIARWETQSWSEKKPKGASGQSMTATSGETTDSGVD